MLDMGMPGAETALEELMCCFLGDLLLQGVVAKLADLYGGGNTVDGLIHNWRLVLQALHHGKLCLSASKTVICPKSTTKVDWIWSNVLLGHIIIVKVTCTMYMMMLQLSHLLNKDKFYRRKYKPHHMTILSQLTQMDQVPER